MNLTKIGNRQQKENAYFTTTKSHRVKIGIGRQRCCTNTRKPPQERETKFMLSDENSCLENCPLPVPQP